MKPKALIWGESLVGSGHARIQSALSRALQHDGWRVAVVTSSRERTTGFDFGDAEIYWQPPLKLSSPSADPYKMSNLVTPNGLRLVDDLVYQEERRDNLLNVYEDLRPHAVITEMWPFARANFDFELIPLAEHLANDFAKAASFFSIARDIMFPPSVSSPDLILVEEDRHRLARQYFKPGHILVRGDDAVLPLETSVGVLSDDVRDRLCYVGYFGRNGENLRTDSGSRKGDVLITSGGGVTRESVEMFKAAISVRHLSPLSGQIWRILIPRSCPQEVFDEIQADSAGVDGIVVERNRSDFGRLLESATLVICHGGNTVVEAISAGTPVLVIPREYAKNNREQQIRAKAFETEGLIVTARISDVQNAGFFATKIVETLSLRTGASEIRLNGAMTAASIITESLYSCAGAQFQFPFFKGGPLTIGCETSMMLTAQGMKAERG